jgi:hypothetical protein
MIGEGLPRLWRPVLFIAGALGSGVVLAACGGNAEPTIFTPVPSPTVTAVPPTPETVRVANAPTPTLILAPTRGPTTPTPGPSPTNPLAPTSSPAPATLTATYVPTLAGLSVEYFTTDTGVVKPGENVTLYWSTRGADRVRIYRVDAEGERIWRWDVSTSGKITVGTRTGDRDVARFLLVAEGADTDVEQPLLIPLQCPEVWFFDPAPEACPAGPPEVSTEAEQTFEHGRMIWVETQDRIYAVFEDDNAPHWAQFPDNFEEGDLERDDSLVPPPGLIQPIRGFGLVWRTNPRVRDRLGWATTPEVSFEGMYQSDSAEASVATFYLRTRDGGILALDSLNDEWQTLPPGPSGDGTAP